MNSHQRKSLPINQNWTRPKNDHDYIEIDNQQSIATLHRTLDPVYTERCEKCLPTEIGFIGKQGISYDSTRPIIDIESELFNLTRPYSKNPKYKYQPKCVNKNCIGIINGCDECQSKLHNFPDCKIRHEHTLISNPKSTLKETGINRFQPLCLNPQDPSRWKHPGEIGINYRLVVKDNHVPCIPRIMDQSLFIPKGGDLPCEKNYQSCTLPIYNYNKNQ
jgi:hypothetical protein